MATTANDATNPTLIDVLKARNPKGGLLPLVEAMSQMNSIVTDAVWKAGNLPTGHMVSMRTGLPSIGARRFNQGVAASKSVRNNFTEAFSMLEGRSQIDVKLAKLNGGGEFRASEDAGFAQSMRNEVERLAWYGASATNPDEFNGIIPRLNSTTGPYGEQIIICDDAASGQDQSSMVLIGWGERSVYMAYPPDSDAGLKVTDRGVQTVTDASDRRYEAYESVFNWDCGLVVEDARQIVRIANIDATNVAAGTSPIIESMIAAYHQIFDPSSVRLAWYANRATLKALDLNAYQAVGNSTLSIKTDMVNGKPVSSFYGIPIRMSDELLTSEDAVS